MNCVTACSRGAQTEKDEPQPQVVDAFGWGLDDLEWVTINSMKSAFAPFPERLDIINRVIKPGYAAARAAAAAPATTA